MNILNMESLWADVHTLHHADSFDYLTDSPYSKLEWKDRAVNTPNGSLMKNNSFFKSMESPADKIYLLHVTKELKKIKTSSTLYPSAGCLIGCVYTTQLYKEIDGSFRMHNLGKHIYQQEATLTTKEPDALIIEVSFDKDGANQTLSGVDYLKLGTIHHAIYQNLRYLLTPHERRELEVLVSNKIKQSLDFISLCSYIENKERTIPGKDFIRILNKQIPKLPILGYIYFEAISQYTMLFSEDETSKMLKNKGEFNNEIYKQFLLDVYNKIGHFKLSDFNLGVEEIERKLDSLQYAGRLDINKEEFFNFIRDQVSHLVTDLFLLDPKQSPAWLKITWDYNGFSEVMAPLVGHVIHRELRNFDRYRDFYFYFDQFKALSAWNYWNKMDIGLPFNGPLQKGEIGINPAYPHATYKIYSAEQSQQSLNHLVISEELRDIEIAPRLVDLRHTAMRSKDHTTQQLREQGAQYARS